MSRAFERPRIVDPRYGSISATGNPVTVVTCLSVDPSLFMLNLETATAIRHRSTDIAAVSRPTSPLCVLKDFYRTLSEDGVALIGSEGEALRYLGQRFHDFESYQAASASLYDQVWMTGWRLTSSIPAKMRSLSSCFEVTRMWRRTERANLEKKPSMRLSHEPCLGVKVNSKRPDGRASSQALVSLDMWAE